MTGPKHSRGGTSRVSDASWLLRHQRQTWRALAECSGPMLDKTCIGARRKLQQKVARPYGTREDGRVWACERRGSTYRPQYLRRERVPMRRREICHDPQGFHLAVGDGSQTLHDSPVVRDG